MKYILTLLCFGVLAGRCNTQEAPSHYHLQIISPLNEEISGNVANIHINKCSELTGRWRLVLDGVEVINQESMKTTWPYNYAWQLQYSGEHILQATITGGDGQIQNQYIKLNN